MSYGELIKLLIEAYILVFLSPTLWYYVDKAIGRKKEKREKTSEV